MDWIHCNKCYFKLQNNVRISLTECGHLFCERCLERIKEARVCCVCNKPAGNSMMLSKDMDPNVQQFFMPFDGTCKRLVEISNFQQQHKTRLLQHMNEKYLFAKRECIRTHNINKKLVNQNHVMRMMLNNNTPGSHKFPFATSTPMSGEIDLNSTSMFTPRPGSVPGRPLRMGPESGPHNRVVPNQRLLLASGSTMDPSPSMRVPSGRDPVPVHRNQRYQTAAAFQQLGSGMQKNSFPLRPQKKE